MNLLITGAGGYLGEHVVHAAIAAKHAVTVAVRPSARLSLPSGVRRLDGDLTDAGFVRRALTGIDGCIFTAGRNWQPGLAMTAYQQQNVAVVATFFAALAEVAPTARVVFTSSMSALAGSLEPIVFTEASDRAAVCEGRLSPYDRAKVECERLARAAREAGRDVVLLNPGYLLGPGASGASGITTTFVVQWCCQGRMPGHVAQGGNSYCDVRDVARAHVMALSPTPERRYIVAGDNLDSLRFHRLLTAQTGVPCPMRVNASLAYAFQALLDGLSTATFGLFQSAAHREFVRALPLYYWGDSSRAERDLGYRSRPVAETLRDTVADFVQRGVLSAEFAWVRDMTDENRPGLLLLRQLARRHLHRQHLLPRLTRILAAARQNDVLNAALQRVLVASRYDEDRGRFVVPGSVVGDVRKLRELLDHVYYASNEFHQRVS